MVPDEDYSLFLKAVCEGDLAGVTRLLDAYPELATMRTHTTFLHWACDENQTAVAKLLLERGADLEARDSGGYTPLQRVCDESKTHPMARWLVEAGANVNCGSRTSPPPLVGAVLENSLDLVKFLIERGANVNATYDMGNGLRSALYFAERDGQQEIAQVLREHGAVPLDPAASAAPRTFRNDVLDHLEKHMGPWTRWRCTKPFP